MPCEHYKDALIDAAASGAPLQGELRAHVSDCTSCRAAFAEELSLFAAISSSLHTVANAEVPASLLPRVRARLDEVVAPRFRWAQPFVFASASVALVAAILLMARVRHTAPVNIAHQGPVMPATMTAPTSKSPDEIPPAGSHIASARAARTRPARSSTIPHSPASGNPEVLVPPDEREGLAKLVATLNEHADVAAAFLAQRPEKKDTLVIVNPLKISDIEIKPLEGAETEASDGAGEKR